MSGFLFIIYMFLALGLISAAADTGSGFVRDKTAMSGFLFIIYMFFALWLISAAADTGSSLLL
jgi:uncharacterized membrane protein